MRIARLFGLLALALAVPARAADVGVAGTRLLVVQRLDDAAKGRVVFEIRGDAGITKGPGTASRRDPAGLDGTLEVYYSDAPETVAGRWVLGAPWKSNRARSARFAYAQAPGGATTVRAAAIREGKLATVIAAGLGDGDVLATLARGAPSAAGGVTVVLTVNNAIDGSTHRLCTRFATDAGSNVRVSDGKRVRKLVATKGVPDDCAADIALAEPAGCELLNQGECLLPYPSNALTVADASTPTGIRLAIPQVGAPHTNGEPVSVEPLNVLDGFSGGSQVLMLFAQGVDVAQSEAARLLALECCGQAAGPPWIDTRTYTDRSLDADSPTVLLDAATGERILHFVEPDARSADSPGRQMLFLRPGRILDAGHRYVVAVRRLVAPDGAPVVAEPAFAMLRDGLHAGIPAIEDRRAAMEANVFAPLATAGIARQELQLAFDFTVRSQERSTDTMLAMRDQAYAFVDAIEANAGQVSFTAAVETENDCDVPGTFVWRYVRGTYESPLFLTGEPTDDTTPFVNRDASGVPVQNGVTHPEYTLTIPCSAKDAMAETREIVLGHGIFQRGEFMTSVVPAIVNLVVPWTAIAAATDWRGLSGQDLAWVGTRILGTSDSQLNQFPAFTGRLQQGMVNTLVLARMMKRGLFNRDPAFQRADMTGVFAGPSEELYYYGVSLGGIMGTYMAGLTPDIERFALDVPAVNFSCLLQRAQPFAAFDFLLPAIGVVEPLEQALGIQLLHELWASAEPVSVVHHVTSDPLPGAGGAKKILYAAAWLDKQVSNQCTEIAARTMGLPNLAGSIQQGLAQIPDVPGPAESAYVMWDLGEIDILDPAHTAHVPPLANVIPDNICDPHPRRPTVPDAIRQIVGFLAPGGQITNPCDGLCDAGVLDEQPSAGCTP